MGFLQDNCFFCPYTPETASACDQFACGSDDMDDSASEIENSIADLVRKNRTAEVNEALRVFRSFCDGYKRRPLL